MIEPNIDSPAPQYRRRIEASEYLKDKWGLRMRRPLSLNSPASAAAPLLCMPDGFRFIRRRRSMPGRVLGSRR
jgi:hypothetical protein